MGRLRRLVLFSSIACALLSPASLAAHPQQKDYLTDAEADEIRDAYTPAERIKLFITFADNRLKRFDDELHRRANDNRRFEVLNGLLNGYTGCVDDAADQIDLAREKQLDIRASLKFMKDKDTEFLQALQQYDTNGLDLDSYRDTLEDAIEATKDALSDVADAEKENPGPPVRRKPS
jgi:hypothetical protein